MITEGLKNKIEELRIKKAQLKHKCNDIEWEL